jgi:hypothetical protein
VLPLLLLLLLLAGPLAGQEKQPLELEVSPATGEVALRLGDLFDDPGVVNALHSGLPVRVRVIAELWRDRLFDSEQARAEWRATVVYEPLERTYLVQTSSPGDHERIVPSLQEVGAILRRRVTVPLRPAERGRYYYIAHLEVETLSLSDLEELARWLRGDLAAAVAGEERMEGALGRGVNRLLVRVLGMPARRVRVRTETFDVEEPTARPHAPPDDESALDPLWKDGEADRQRLDPLQVGLDCDSVPGGE